jgi:riboflavin biosynthesis pyrimidine reductase
MDEAWGVPDGRWVRANFAVTVDGAIELDGRSGGIGGAEDRRVFAHLRTLADVVLVGAGTARTEGYGAVRIDAEARERRERRGQAPAVPVAVVTARAALDPTARLFTESASEGGARPVVVTCAAAPQEAVDALRAVAEVLVCGEGAVDISLALDLLAARGLRRALCEGGPSLLATLVTGNLLDELCLTSAPLLGGGGHGGLLGREALPAPVRLAVHAMATDGEGTVFTSYRPIR